MSEFLLVSSLKVVIANSLAAKPKAFIKGLGRAFTLKAYTVEAITVAKSNPYTPLLQDLLISLA